MTAKFDFWPIFYGRRAVKVRGMLKKLAPYNAGILHATLYIFGQFNPAPPCSTRFGSSSGIVHLRFVWSLHFPSSALPQAEREQRDKEERHEAKMAMLAQKEEEKRLAEERKEQAALRSYNTLQDTDNMIGNAGDNSALEDDFM